MGFGFVPFCLYLPKFPERRNSQRTMDYHRMNREMEDSVHTPARPTTLTNRMGGVVDFVVNNENSLNAALQVLDMLANIGKAMPFVAPAFVMLKVILDLERQAQDVDAKCNDLLERITFMLSHLPALQQIEIMPATRKVIDRINEALKDAASLISAYRKQSRVARRLKISNRDNFRTCAESINSCCGDLLMSLQIQQTVRLDILTRDIPVDAEDKAAQTFVETHGGSVDAVMHDRELVKEFCQQQHLVMDDSVMEQLNTSIADSVKQNHARLENILRDNVGSAIADGLKNLAMEMNALEAEQKFRCVQCDKEFTNLTNGAKSCSFHRAEYDSRAKVFPCCSGVHPCEFRPHRAKHHCDYPYGNFFDHTHHVLRTHDDCATVEDTNLESDETQKAFVGHLRSKAYGDRVEVPTLLVVVGRVSFRYPYYFNTFTAKDLEDINKSVRLSRRTLIFRTSSSQNEFAMAEWILSVSGDITGIRVTARTATSPSPWARECTIDLATCTISGDTLTTSEGGMRSYTPATPYILPENVTISPIINTKSRAPRTNFKTKTCPSLRVVLKAESDPPLQANPDNLSTKFDHFRGKISVFNNNLPGPLNPVTISSVSAFYRMVGDSEYAPAEKCQLLDGDDKMPITIEPRQSWQLNFKVTVPRSEEDAALGELWKFQAFLARHRPVRIKLVLEDIEGEQCSLVLEYVFQAQAYPLTTRGKSDIGFFFFDDPILFERYGMHVRPVDDPSRFVMDIDTNMLTAKGLEKMVYYALKSGETEVDLNIGQTEAKWEWKAWALIDLSCQRVYAFKIIVQEGKKIPIKRCGCIGYVLCPPYGDVSDEKRPISYATETAKLPPLEPYPVQDYPQDDTLDDFVPPIPPKPMASDSASLNGAGAAIPYTIPVELTNRLASLDTNLTLINTNLARIAAAFEKLVSVMPNTGGDASSFK